MQPGESTKEDFAFKKFGGKSKEPDGQTAGAAKPATPAAPWKATAEPVRLSKRDTWKTGGDYSGTGPAKPRQAQVLDPTSETARRIAMFREEAGLDPKNVDLLSNFGEALLEGGQVEEAKGIYGRILKLDPAADFARAKLREVCTPAEFRDLRLPAPIVIFWTDFSGLIRYPFSGDGVYILVFGAALQSFFMLLVSAAQSLGPLALQADIVLGVVLFIVNGYLFKYYFDVARTTVAGQSEPPGWPEFHPVDVIATMLRVVFMTAYWIIVPGLAALLFMLILGSVIPQAVGGILVLLLAAVSAVLAIVWMPMAYTALALFNNVGAIADPRFIFASILKVPKDYMIAWLSLAAIWFAWTVASILLFAAVMVCRTAVFDAGDVLGIVVGAVVWAPVSSVLGIYGWMITSRLVGLFFRQCQTKLHWFVD